MCRICSAPWPIGRRSLNDHRVHGAVLNTGTLREALKELGDCADIAVESRALCLVPYTAIACKRGWTEGQIEALHHAGDNKEFSERGKVAIHLAVMTRNAHGYSEAEFMRPRSYSEDDIVELMAGIELFKYFDRFNDLMEWEPAQPTSAEELATVAINVAAAV
jgi:hypothetical protein